MSFGKGVDAREMKAVNPGINAGFYAESLFEKKEGDSWGAYIFKFTGPIPVRDTVFLPTRRAINGNYIKTEGDVEKAWNDDVKKFNEQLNMYAKMWYPKGDNTVDSKIPAYNSADEFMADLENYVSILKSCVPANASEPELELILGRSKGDKYLNPPKSCRITGSYVRRVNDSTRELSLSSIFKSDYSFEVPQSGGGTQSFTGNGGANNGGASSVNW